jgi:YYY domain-containing protein
VLGLVAAVALPLAGNLEIGLEILHANGVGAESFWSWLDVRDLNRAPQLSAPPRYETSQWWWWRSSRVIHEYHLSGRAEEGLEPIAEYPAFSFILGDLHPHVLALPFAFLGLAVALCWYLGRYHTGPAGRSWSPGIETPIRPRQGAFFLFSALVLGGLSFLNTWDVLIHLFLVVGAFALARWRGRGYWSRADLRDAVALGAALILAAVLLYLPFYLGFRSQAGPPFLLPMTMRPTRLSHFLIIFGMPVLVIVPTLLALVAGRYRAIRASGAWRTGLLLAAGLLVSLFVLMVLFGWVVALSTEGSTRVANLAADLGILVDPPPAGTAFAARIGWATAAVAQLIPTYALARLQFGLLTLLLALILAAVVMVLIAQLTRQADRQEELPSDGPRSAGATPFLLLMIGTGALLTLGPEFLYLRDNFGQRLNTIFKFYYQAWVLWGVAAICGLYVLWQVRRALAAVSIVVYGIALVVALMLPYFAVQSRSIEYRGAPDSPARLPATLDGLAYLERWDPAEYQAIMWLRTQGEQAVNIVEAVGGQYSSYGRVSASTGLPTILGWPGHQYQWRGNTREPAEREPAVALIYSPASWEETAALLDRYDVTYVYFGPQERLAYDPRAEQKFDRNLSLAYAKEVVKIYRWHPGLRQE